MKRQNPLSSSSIMLQNQVPSFLIQKLYQVLGNINIILFLITKLQISFLVLEQGFLKTWETFLCCLGCNVTIIYYLVPFCGLLQLFFTWFFIYFDIQTYHYASRKFQNCNKLFICVYFQFPSLKPIILFDQAREMTFQM